LQGRTSIGVEERNRTTIEIPGIAGRAIRHDCGGNRATIRQLMAMFGWDSPRTAEVYTRAAEQKRLAGGAMFLIALERGNGDCRTPAAVPKLSTSNQ
jgi:hypothetical protein